MANDDQHPSYLELDRASLGVASSSTEEHLRRCARCAEHVKTAQVQLPVPAWVQGQADMPRRPVWQPPWAWVGVAATAVVVAVLVIPNFIGPPGPEPPPSIEAKGAIPSIAVYVKRGERVMLWSGDVPLEPGDLVRLQVAPEGYSHIVVSTVGSSGANEVLYEGEVEPKGPGFLPVSWRVEEDPQTSESLEITLSFRGRGNDAGNRGDIWTKKLLLPKHVRF